MEKTKQYRLVRLDHVKIDDPLWSERQNTVRDSTIPEQWEILNDRREGIPPSHSVENLRIASGDVPGTFVGRPFQDTDLYKWIEAASYSYALNADSRTDAELDEAIGIIARAQRPDGYINSYFTVAHPDKRWTDISHGHELYCAGHLFEAAAAHFDSTGKRTLLDVAARFADLIERELGPDSARSNVYPGHPEVELGLVRLYDATGNRRYLTLARHFVDVRGRDASVFRNEPGFGGQAGDRWFDLDYHQAHLPVSEQRDAEGHAVRAMYLYAAMTDIADRFPDSGLEAALAALWTSVTAKRMYVTSGIGSQEHGERFTVDYDLPNDTAYAETCASIGLAFWAQRLLLRRSTMTASSAASGLSGPAGAASPTSPAEILERALYNGTLSGISLEGTHYFYVNPLEAAPAIAGARYDHEHVLVSRTQWFGCACCPPNIARLTMSVGRYIYTESDDTIAIHLYVGNSASLAVGDLSVDITLRAGLPASGEVAIDVAPARRAQFALALRVPSWASAFDITVNGSSMEAQREGGYATIRRTWEPGDGVKIRLGLSVRRLYADPRVRETAGKVALQYGPQVFCLEQADNGSALHSLLLPPGAPVRARFDSSLLGGVVVLEADGVREVPETHGPDNVDGLYTTRAPESERTRLSFIPYYAWANRGAGEMIVWVRESRE